MAIAAMTAAAAFAWGGVAVANPIFQAKLSGSNEVPPNASTAIGLSTVTLSGNTLDVDETFSGLTAAATEAHIHCCAPPGGSAGVVIPFVGFLAATSGTYIHSFDPTDPAVYNTAFLAANGGTAAGAEAALITGLETVNAYANIHDAIFPEGEISVWYRAVPEPASLVLLAAALVGLALTRRGFAANSAGTASTAASKVSSGLSSRPARYPLRPAAFAGHVHGQKRRRV